MSTAVGIVLIVIGGILSGLYTTPMRFVKGWKWEHTWLLYSFFGCVVLPWINALAACPDLGEVYSHSQTKWILEALGFGTLWGIGSLLFGLAVDRVGNSLSFSIILGLTSTFGSALPLVVLNPDEITSKAGVFTWIGLGIVIVGLIFLGFAGHLKEQEQKATKEEEIGVETPLLNPGMSSVKPTDYAFQIGLLFCVLSGIFSSCLNLGVSFAQPIADMAHCNPESLNKNAVWPLAVAGGFVVNFIYCAAKIQKERTWFIFGQDLLRNLIITLIMGGFWFQANVLYGVGTSMLDGQLGTVVGWPIYLNGMILTANISGVVMGEWRGTKLRSRLLMIIGLAIMIGAIVVVALGSD